MASVLSHVAGESILAVGAEGSELECLVIHLVAVPDTVVEGNRAAAMQAVAVIVGDELVLLAVERELAVADAVAIATDECTEVAAVGTILDIVGYVVMTQAHVGHLAVLVGHHDADDASAEVGEAYFHACCVLQYVKLSAVCLEVGGVQS